MTECWLKAWQVPYEPKTSMQDDDSALPSVSGELLETLVYAKGNGSDGASIYLPDGAFVAITCWVTMWDKMQGATSAQAANDRDFYNKHIPKSTRVLVRITRREVIKMPNGKVMLKSVDNWLQADDLLEFPKDFHGVHVTSKGHDFLREHHRVGGASTLICEHKSEKDQ